MNQLEQDKLYRYHDATDFGNTHWVRQDRAERRLLEGYEFVLLNGEKISERGMVLMKKK